MTDFNPIPQNQVLYSSAGPYTLRTPAGVTITTAVDGTPPSTTTEQNNPNDIMVEEVVGPQRVTP